MRAKSRMKHFSEVLKFSLTGILVVATDGGIYYLLINVLDNPVAKGMSFTCGGIVAYVLNKYWTFKQEKKSNSEVLRFIFANFLALGLNIGVNQFILHSNNNAIFTGLLGATTATAVFTFIVFKFWVFRSNG